MYTKCATHTGIEQMVYVVGLTDIYIYNNGHAPVDLYDGPVGGLLLPVPHVDQIGHRLSC